MALTPTETRELLARLGHAPKRFLGQNFLVDSNILGVIARHGELDQRDVVLEIGGGLGVLSEYLAARVAHVVEDVEDVHGLLASGAPRGARG